MLFRSSVKTDANRTVAVSAGTSIARQSPGTTANITATTVTLTSSTAGNVSDIGAAGNNNAIVIDNPAVNGVTALTIAQAAGNPATGNAYVNLNSSAALVADVTSSITVGASGGGASLTATRVGVSNANGTVILTANRDLSLGEVTFNDGDFGDTSDVSLTAGQNLLNLGGDYRTSVVKADTLRLKAGGYGSFNARNLDQIRRLVAATQTPGSGLSLDFERPTALTLGLATAGAGNGVTSQGGSISITNNLSLAFQADYGNDQTFTTTNGATVENGDEVQFVVAGAGFAAGTSYTVGDRNANGTTFRLFSSYLAGVTYNRVSQTFTGPAAAANGDIVIAVPAGADVPNGIAARDAYAVTAVNGNNFCLRSLDAVAANYDGANKTFTVVGHGFASGERLVLTAAVSGFAADTVYTVDVVDVNSFKLRDSNNVVAGDNNNNGINLFEVVGGTGANDSVAAPGFDILRVAGAANFAVNGLTLSRFDGQGNVADTSLLIGTAGISSNGGSIALKSSSAIGPQKADATAGTIVGGAVSLVAANAINAQTTANTLTAFSTNSDVSITQIGAMTIGIAGIASGAAGGSVTLDVNGSIAAGPGKITASTATVTSQIGRAHV